MGPATAVSLVLATEKYPTRHKQVLRTMQGETTSESSNWRLAFKSDRIKTLFHSSLLTLQPPGVRSWILPTSPSFVISCTASFPTLCLCWASGSSTELSLLPWEDLNVRSEHLFQNYFTSFHDAALDFRIPAHPPFVRREMIFLVSACTCSGMLSPASTFTSPCTMRPWLWGPCSSPICFFMPFPRDLSLGQCLHEQRLLRGWVFWMVLPLLFLFWYSLWLSQWKINRKSFPRPHFRRKMSCSLHFAQTRCLSPTFFLSNKWVVGHESFTSGSSTICTVAHVCARSCEAKLTSFTV